MSINLQAVLFYLSLHLFYLHRQGKLTPKYHSLNHEYRGETGWGRRQQTSEARKATAESKGAESFPSVW